MSKQRREETRQVRDQLGFNMHPSTLIDKKGRRLDWTERGRGQLTVLLAKARREHELSGVSEARKCAEQATSADCDGRTTVARAVV